jgi:hypothetical protein
MTEADWLAARDPDQMLRAAGDRLSARRWRLLAGAFARWAWDRPAAGPLAAALDAAELHHPEPDVTVAVADAAVLARAEARAVVAPAYPDAQPADFRDAPLPRAACEQARLSVELAAQAVAAAGQALACAARQQPTPAQLDVVREHAREAARLRGRSGLAAGLALKLAALADETAGRPSRQRAAADLQRVRREAEYAGYRAADLDAAKGRADRRLLGRLLHEVVGNPFRPVPFDPAWRTPDVVALAAGIDADAAFDRLPVLADALLDADCDSEPILRHCRGLDRPPGEPAFHARGCWVIDLLLGREAAGFARPALKHRGDRRPARAGG